MISWLADTLLYTGLLIALVLVVRRPVARHFGPKTAYGLWALPALRFVLPPVVLPASMAPAQPEAPVGEAAVYVFTLAADAAPMAAPEPAPLWERADLLLPLWLGGAALFLAWRIATYLRMRRELLVGARTVGEVGRIRLVETPAVSSPVAFGVYDKVVALPRFFMAMEDRAARDLAIAHELAHHRGHDLIANFAAQPLLALHWFNPLAWIGWRAMRRDQEAACDARVMEGRGRDERAAYAGLIAGFAAGPRPILTQRALAAPMACPMVGEKSIIHRLRSLSMSDISPTRRLLGRLLLAGGAVALPLTASISYAQDGEGVQPVELPPSAAATDAGDEDGQREVRVFELRREAGDEADATEVAGKDGEKRVKVFRLHREGGDDAGPGKDVERHIFVMRNDGPLTEEQRQKFEEMARDWEKRGAEWEARAAELEKMAPQWEKMARDHQKLALAFADTDFPQVIEDCDDKGSVSRSTTDERGRRQVVICTRRIEGQARMGALMNLRGARNMIAHNREMSEEVRKEVLAELDGEISRLEADKD